MTLLGDALVLTMTRGVTLADWHRLGMIEREWALPAAMLQNYPRVLIVSAGGADERDIARAHCPGGEVICDDRPGDGTFERRAPAMVHAALSKPPAGARSRRDAPAGRLRVTVRTNQMEGGSLACAIAHHLRALGHDAALIARGGYCFSRFVGEREGFDSPACASARDEESRLCALSDAIICSTHEMAADLAWRCGLGLERIRVVPNYVLMDDEPSTEGRDGREILVAGQLIERKRTHLVIEAMALLSDRLGRGGAPPMLTIVGEGPLRRDLEALANARRVRARFLGSLPHAALRARMRSAGIFAHASALEGHPKTVLEAMASGCAIVACDAPGTRGVLEHERTALLTRGEARAIADAIERLLESEALARSLSTSAWRWAREHVALDRVVALEREAHEAVRRWREAARVGTPAAQGHAAPPPGAAPGLTRTTPGVRFDPALLDEPHERSVRAFADAVGGYWKRLPARDGSRFLMGLDDALYRLHGHAAIADGDGLHPKHRLTRYHDFFCARLAPGERVLDLGCGVGALACAIAHRAGARVTGIDLNERSLERAAARAREMGVAHLARFVHADITTIDGEACDTIVLSNVLEHLRDRAGLLARWRERTGCARFLIRVPMLERDWRVPWKRELGVEWRLDETHETEYIEEELRGELREAGLRESAWITRWGEFWVEARSSR